MCDVENIIPLDLIGSYRRLRNKGTRCGKPNCNNKATRGVNCAVCSTQNRDEWYSVFNNLERIPGTRMDCLLNIIEMSYLVKEFDSGNLKIQKVFEKKKITREELITKIVRNVAYTKAIN